MGPAVWAMFALWVGYGFLRWRNARPMLLALGEVPQKAKPLRATAWLFGGAIVLLGTLYLLYLAKGFPSGGVALWAWPIAAAAGLFFVHSQVTAGAMLVSMAVTQRAPQPSHSEKESNPI